MVAMILKLELVDDIAPTGRKLSHIIRFVMLN